MSHHTLHVHITDIFIGLVFSSLRAYALSRNKFLSIVVFFLGAVVPIGIAIVSRTSDTSLRSPAQWTVLGPFLLWTFRGEFLSSRMRIDI